MSNTTERNLSFLESNDAEALAVNGQQVEWKCLKTLIDSGASENVMSSKTTPWIPTKESEGSRRGQTYSSANGSPMKNEGQKNINFITDDGQSLSTTWQIAEVTKPLRSVARICDNGMSVHFFADGGYMEDTTNKRRLYFNREGNQYTHNEWVQASGFTRSSE